MAILAVSAFATMSSPAVADATLSTSGKAVTMDLAQKLDLMFGHGHRSAAAGQGARPDHITRTSLRSPEAEPDLIVYSTEWLDALPELAGDAQWRCLAEALYHEARGESVKGQFAVAEVILNRVASPLWPSTVCTVVNQGTGRLHQCQFSYTCDGRSDAISERRAYERVGKVARLMLAGAPRVLTGGATHYHTTAVSPRWSRAFPRTAQIGAHLFYRHPRS